MQTFDTKTTNAIIELKNALSKDFENNIDLFLFGSYARQSADSDSDIDILVLLDGQVDNEIRNKIFDKAYDIQLEFDVVFGIIVYSKNFWYSKKGKSMPLFKNVEKESIKV